MIAEWQAQPQPPRSLVEVMVLAEAHATMGEAEPARALIEALAAWQPIEADALRARLAFSLGEHGASWQALSRALAAYAHEPWPNLALMRRTLPLALALAKAQPDLAPEILAALEQPAAVSMLDYLRLELWLSLALERGDAASCRRAVAALEPHFPWQEPLLRQRIACFELGQDGRLPHARAELAAYLADSGVDFGAGLRPAEPAPMIQLEPAAPRE